MDFLIDPQVFNKELKGIASQIPNHGSVVIDFTAEGDTLMLETDDYGAGVDIECLVEGSLRLPLDLAIRIGEVANTYTKGRIQIKGQDGVLKIGETTITNTEITSREAVRRVIRIPTDAPAIDVLAADKLFTRVEIEQSALESRVIKAKEHLQRQLGTATEALAEFGVGYQELLELVKAHISEHAPTIKEALLSS